MFSTGWSSVFALKPPVDTNVMSEGNKAALNVNLLQRNALGLQLVGLLRYIAAPYPMLSARQMICY